MQYIQPIGPQGPANAFGNDYVDKNAGAGIAGSFLAADMPEHVQIEILNVIAKSGWTPSAADLLQMTKAIRSQRLNYVLTVGGTANALTATLDPVPANRAEMIASPITLKIAATNTAAATLNLGYGAVAIKRPNGADIVAGDLLAAQLVTVRDDGTNFVIVSAFPPVAGQSQVYSTPGTYTFIVPAGVTLLKTARVWGAGGGGAGSSGSGNAGSGGAGAGYCEGPIVVVPGQSITVTVGAKGTGGAGGGSPQNGGNGGASSVGSFLTTSIALGGVTGGTIVPPGGTSSGGVFRFQGRAGGSALNFGSLIGGFGGGAYGGGDTPFGVNGGVEGLGPGAGGSGAANGNAGGAGQNGLVILEW